MDDDERPQALDDAYRIQDALVALLGDSCAGYKIAATSRRAQDYLEIENPLYGRVLSDALYESPAELPTNAFNFALAEPEFAFRMGEDLPTSRAPFEFAEVERAAGALIPALEIVTSAWQDWMTRGGPAIAADTGAHGCLVLGQDHEDWRHLDLAAHQVRVAINAEGRGEGSGAVCLGHPLNALTWLANETARRGPGLKAGEVVTTGVVTPFHYLNAGDEVSADFGTLGRVSFRLSP